EGATMLDPAREVPELHVENRCVDVVEQCRVSVCVKLSGRPVLAVVPQERRAPCDLRVVSRQRSAVADSSERLQRIEAEASGRPERSGHPGPESRTERLRGVLDDGESVRARE